KRRCNRRKEIIRTAATIDSVKMVKAPIRNQSVCQKNGATTRLNTAPLLSHTPSLLQAMTRKTYLPADSRGYSADRVDAGIRQSSWGGPNGRGNGTFPGAEKGGGKNSNSSRRWAGGSRIELSVEPKSRTGASADVRTGSAPPYQASF